MLAAQTVNQRSVFTIRDRSDGAGVDDQGVALRFRCEGVSQCDELLLHRLRFVLVDLTAEGKTMKFHILSPKILFETFKKLNKRCIAFLCK